MGKNETISSKIRNEKKVSTLTTLIQYSTGISSQSNKTEERNKAHSYRKGNLKFSLFSEDMNLYLNTLTNLLESHKHI
jgi:hypothetical protein